MSATVDLDWLVGGFAGEVPGVLQTAVVSTDGLLLARSGGGAEGDDLPAITAGLTSLAEGAARCFHTGRVAQVIVDMDRCMLFLASVGAGSTLAVLADEECDPGLIGYEMARLVVRAESLLTPELIAEMRAAGAR